LLTVRPPLVTWDSCVSKIIFPIIISYYWVILFNSLWRLEANEKIIGKLIIQSEPLV
jgi:hypothetical protein